MMQSRFSLRVLEHRDRHRNAPCTAIRIGFGLFRSAAHFRASSSIDATTACRRVLALLLTVNYIAFHVEPFEEEHLRHCAVPSNEPSFRLSAENWETYNKCNVPVATTYMPLLPEILACRLRPLPIQDCLAHVPYSPVRDKSPPSSPTS